MYVVIITSIVALFLTYLGSFKNFKKGLACCFILVTFVASIQYYYGNDYGTYLQWFVNSSSIKISWSSAAELFRDPGWILLCRLCRPIGFFGLVILISVVENLIYYFFIKTHVSVKWQVFAVFIYLFSTNFYLLNFSMLRQGLSVSLCVLSYLLMEKDKRILPLAVLLLAISFHYITIVFLPVFLFQFFQLNNTRPIAIAVLVLFVFLFFNASLLDDFLYKFAVNESLEEYINEYSETEGTQFGLGFVIDCIPFLILLWFLLHNSGTKYEKLLVIIASIGSLVVPFQQRYAIIGRVGFFFSAFYIAAIPMVYGLIKGKWLRLILVTVFVLLLLFRYWSFFTVGSFVEYYSKPFQTVFGVPWQ